MYDLIQSVINKDKIKCDSRIWTFREWSKQGELFLFSSAEECLQFKLNILQF